jgi:mycothiol synthase
MDIQARPYAGDEDIEAISRFLLDTYVLNQTLHNWEPRQWQGSIYHRDDAESTQYRARLPELVRIWQAPAGQIVGVTTHEFDGGVFLQIHPEYRHIEADMLDWAEAHLAQVDESGSTWLEVRVYDYDQYRTELLRRRGYTQTGQYENLRRRSMTLPIPDIPVPDGYIVRTMRHHPEDRQHLAALLNAAFRRDFHSAEEYRNFQSAPIYRAEFDIVVEAPDGALVANAGFTVYENESFALIEPVCTHPDHQNKGLARAAIAEGLRRVQATGIKTTYIGAWYSNMAANHIYEQMGLTHPVRSYCWRKTW